MGHENNLLDYNISHAPALQKVVDPFLQFSGLKTFGYQRFFADGSHLSLFNNLPWARYYLENVTSAGEMFLQDNRALMEGHIIPNLWPTCKKDPVLSALHQHNIWYGISFYRLRDNYLEAWEFSATCEDPQALNFYVAHGGKFLQFIAYFNKMLQEVIDTKDTALFPQFQKNLFPTWSLPDLTKNGGTGKNMPENHKVFGLQGLISLSHQEWACARLLTQGQSTKEIGRGLDLSYRTVEEYLLNAKKKMGVKKNTEMVACLSA